MDLPASLLAPRSNRVKIGLGAAVLVVLVGLVVAVVATAVSPSGSTEQVSPSAAVSRSPQPSNSGAAQADTPPGGGSVHTIYVHVLGAVTHPGLYLLADGDRAVDLIGAAGGFTATADQSTVNLARLLVDGEQVAVPNIGEVIPVQPAGAGQPAGGQGGEAKVSINTGDQAALETLPRVGPALAKRIIDWRTKNGRFTSLEDLMSVTGFGQKTFDSLKSRLVL